jgi:hypothetical protein
MKRLVDVTNFSLENLGTLVAVEVKGRCRLSGDESSLSDWAGPFIRIHRYQLHFQNMEVTHSNPHILFNSTFFLLGKLEFTQCLLLPSF